MTPIEFRKLAMDNLQEWLDGSYLELDIVGSALVVMLKADQDGVSEWELRLPNRAGTAIHKYVLRMSVEPMEVKDVSVGS